MIVLAQAEPKSRSVPARVASVIPGLTVAALAALFGHLLAALTPLPAVFFALLIGIGIASAVPTGRFLPGVDFASREVLRFGVALLGLAVTFGEIAKLGWPAALAIIAALVMTLLLGTAICRGLGQSRGSAMVSAAAVAICGASAAMAVAAVHPKGHIKEDEVARTVAGITIAGSIALLTLPYLATAMGFSPTQTGVFLGGSIHEVAQAAAAGFSLSDEVGKVATVSKMLRVACMGTVVAFVGLIASRGHSSEGKRPPLFPGFLIAFVVLAVLSSAGVVPAALKDAAIDVSRWCLLIAIAALGLRTSSGTLAHTGARPLLAIAINSLFLTGLLAVGVFLIGS